MNRAVDAARSVVPRLGRSVVSLASRFGVLAGRGAGVVTRWAWVAGIVFWTVGYPLLRVRDREVAYNDALARARYQNDLYEASEAQYRRDRLRHQ